MRTVRRAFERYPKKEVGTLNWGYVDLKDFDGTPHFCAVLVASRNYAVAAVDFEVFVAARQLDFAGK